MTVFEIVEEKGLSRVLSYSDLPPTPWLLETSNGLSISNTVLHQIILSERGIMPLLDPLEQFESNGRYDVILNETPEWSIITPRLYPASKTLVASLEYELNLFLDRLDGLDLPKAFGLVYDPVMSDENHLSELLKFNPSIIVIRFPPVEDTSPRKFSEIILNIRKLVPPNIALYLPGSGGIGYQTLLIALGIDILDTLPAYRSAARKRSYFDHSIIYQPKRELIELVDENLTILREDMKNIQVHLVNNTLWTRLAREMHVHPKIASLVNIILNNYMDLIPLSKFAKHSTNELLFTGEEGLNHPDVIAYQTRLLETYIIPDTIKLVILLPCSARKPYYESYSHKIYAKIMKSAAKGQQAAITVWSLTSPLGVVPRELETVFPAQHYDIPVTGDWSVEESIKCGTILQLMIEKLPDNVKIIVHVSQGYRKMIDFVSKSDKIIISWIGDNSRSDSALTKLKDVIKSNLGIDNVQKLTKKLYFTKSKDIVQALVRYNHGKNVKIDFKQAETKFLGRPPRPIQIQKNKKHWITWDKLAGNTRLSETAVLEVANESNKWILVDTHRLKGSNLFAVGVKLASEDISPGDEVIFFNSNKKKILGVGVAKISGISMNQLSNGIVASIRKKIKSKLQNRG